MAAPEAALRVSVVYALPERQTVLEVVSPTPLSAVEAVHRSGVLSAHPELDPAALNLGVHGELVAPDTPLRDGDRVEIYRPLRMDPREARRQLARHGRVMGRSGSGE